MAEREDIVRRASKHVGYLSGQGFDQKNRFSDFLGHPAEARCGDFVTLMSGNDVKQWQVQMRKRGWKLPHDGEYDERTRDVCVAFQQQKGLPDSGRVGPRTWALAWTAPITPD